MAFLKDSEYTRRRKTDTIVIHCADTTASMDIGAAEIRKWHVHERGWKDIGYHFVIRRNGSIEAGRPIWALPAAVMGDNHHIIAIVMVGGCAVIRGKKRQQDNFTPEQWTALKSCMAGVFHKYPQIAAVKGHRQYQEAIDQGKYCPSFDVPTWWTTAQEEVLAMAKTTMT